MKQKIVPNLWLDTEAEEAAEFYVSVFDNSRIVNVTHYTKAGPREAGMETQEEVDYYWGKLTEGGAESQCGWLKDRYGLSWQVVPTGMEELFADPDPKRAERAMRAMLGMSKLNIAALRRAAEGDTGE